MSNFSKIWYNQTKIDKNWQKLIKIGENHQKLSKIDKNCQKLSKIDKNCQKLSKIVKNCQKLSKIVKNCQKLTKSVHPWYAYHKIGQNPEKICRKILSDINFCQILSENVGQNLYPGYSVSLSNM